MGVKLTNSGGPDARTAAGRAAIATAARVARIEANADAQARLERARFNMENSEVNIKTQKIREVEAIVVPSEKEQLLRLMVSLKNYCENATFNQSDLAIFEKDCQLARAYLQKYKESIMWAEMRYSKEQMFQTFLSDSDFISTFDKKIIKKKMLHLRRECESVCLEKNDDYDSLRMCSEAARERLKNYKDFFENSKMQYPNDQEFQAFLIESEKFIAPFNRKVIITKYWYYILPVAIMIGLVVLGLLIWLLCVLTGE